MLELMCCIRLQDVDTYEYELPEDFEDEEIDEDEAFNSEDEKLYGHLFSQKYSESEGSESEEEPSDEGHAAFDALASDEEWPDEEDWDDGGRQSFHSGQNNVPVISRGKNGGDEDAIHDDDDGDASTGGEGDSADEELVTEAYPESVFAMPSQGMYDINDFV